MLAPASEALSNPCLPAAWREAYGPWAFLFATAAMMGMHLVDYLVKVGAGRAGFSQGRMGGGSMGTTSTGPCRPASVSCRTSAAASFSCC